MRFLGRMFLRVKSSQTGPSRMASSAYGNILGNKRDRRTVSNNTIGNPIAPFVFVIANSAANPAKLNDKNLRRLLKVT